MMRIIRMITSTGVVTLLWHSFQVAAPFCTLMYSLRQLRRGSSEHCVRIRLF